MSGVPDRVSRRWQGAQAYRPGDSAGLNAEILALMRAGVKTASCEAWDYFADTGEAVPEVGRVDIALDWQGRPALALRTLDVSRLRFDEMSEELVAAQGEFRDLAAWRRGYEAYLTRAGRFRPDVEMLLERFELVADLAR
ncbi:ASCH domain-containing protein [Salipiger sp. P9]|uniref:ASCH domain-containing protein n=1 Tax=Salipiger pentaromativorans TaxID=2943193 RepID=UPI0021588A37|nr:ASCH domain-containing protein [Salipiger pentaromativorans]MCR8546279.1 ASCH domain-containing protein [Salipiger pentaromativorans]